MCEDVQAIRAVEMLRCAQHDRDQLVAQIMSKEYSAMKADAVVFTKPNTVEFQQVTCSTKA